MSPAQVSEARKTTRAVSLARMVLTFKMLYGIGDREGANKVYLAILASRFPGRRREAALKSIANWQKERDQWTS